MSQSQQQALLKSRFLSSLPPEARGRVFGLTEETGRLLGQWMARYPAMRSVRIPQICLTLAAAGPFLDARALLPSAQLVAWIFSIDDMMDEELLPYPELCDRVDRSLPILDDAEGANAANDPIFQGLQEIRDGLRRNSGYRDLRPHWADGTRRLLFGMRQEQTWSLDYRTHPDRPVPSLDEYIENGWYSIGVPATYRSALIAISDGSTPAHLSKLCKMEQGAATGIRLANDLQSYAREVTEQKLNSITIRQRELMALDAGKPEAEALAEARADIQQRMKAALEPCLALGNDARTTTGRPEMFIMSLGSFACDFYVHHDYHHHLIQ